MPVRLSMEFLRHIETLFRSGTAGGLTDEQLLDRFLVGRGEDAEAAFAALVDRHGAMVLRLCRQILRGEEDAEDAAQAAFLVLARRAGSISRRESVACWLHGVALRVAGKARAAATRRRAHELRGGEMRTAGHIVDADLEAVENHDDWAALHDELGSLPQSFRDPLILCYLDGLTQEQAAAQLRCPLGTIQSRLARGRAKLRVRLEKRGVGLATLFARANHVAVHSFLAPPAWAEATVQLAIEFAQGRAQSIAGSGAASVTLAEAVISGAIVTKLKIAMAMILLVGVLVSSASVWAKRESQRDVPIAATNLGLPQGKPELAFGNAVQPLPKPVHPTIRGVVREQQGQMRLPGSPLPARESPPSATVDAAGPAVLSGRVVDLGGNAVAGAKVTTWFDFRWKDAVTTGPAGDFVLGPTEKTRRSCIKVAASGFATRCFELSAGDVDPEGKALTDLLVDSSGTVKKPIALGPGVDLTGRVLNDGKPAAGVSIRLRFDERSDPFPLDSSWAQTDDNGVFRFRAVPADTEFWLHSGLGSLKAGGLLGPVRVRTARDASLLDVGELHIKKGRTLAGRLRCSDGKAVPEGIAISVGCPVVGGFTRATIGPDGRFEFRGLPDGTVSLGVRQVVEPEGTRYEVSPKNRCADPSMIGWLNGRLDHDIVNLTILLDPWPYRKSPDTKVYGLDAAVTAVYDHAKGGPITGVPPE
jgi:RNA polymerase sigma factor (sigma-70 family)